VRAALVVGNWKMHGSLASAGELAAAVVGAVPVEAAVDVVLAPAFPHLEAVATATRETRIEVAAQDMFWADRGPYTGAVSPTMVRELARWVILGHSERRTLFLETDVDVNRKVHAAFHHDLLPIACVGETEVQRDDGQTDHVVLRQLDTALEGISAGEAARAVVAYEPVWAIGTGRACDAVEAGRVARLIRAQLDAVFGSASASATRVIYGGSVTPENAAAYFVDPDVDGALVGGASLRAEGFAAIVEAAAATWAVQ
jgi:triosephosphate isomerase